MVKETSYKEQIENRREELYEEYGHSEYSQVQINEILRDEFSDEDYEESLKDLGINDSEEDLGLEYENEDEAIESTTEGKENILRLMLANNKHIKHIYLKLMGFKEKGDKTEYKGKSLIPEQDIDFMIDTIATLYQPQSLSGKLKKDIKYFDDHYNTILNNFRSRLAKYSDDICNANELRTAMDLFLTQVLTVRYAIINGRLGDLTRDTTNNSYTEKEDISSTDQRVEEAKQKFKF